MDIRNLLPGTESLYKFMTLSGLVLILAGSYLYLLKRHELRIAFIDAHEQLAVERIQAAGMKDAEARERAYRVIAAKELASGRRAGAIALQVTYIQRASIAFLGGGLLLAIVGFRRWSYLQRLEVRILKKQALGESASTDPPVSYRVAGRYVSVERVTTILVVIAFSALLLYIAENRFRFVLLAMAVVLGVYRLVGKQHAEPRSMDTTES